MKSPSELNRSISFWNFLAAGILVFTCLISLFSCHRTILTSDAWAMKASDVPEYFKPGQHRGDKLLESSGSSQCHNPMVDPRDSTKIYLVRSFDGRGDYEVPEGKYGVKKNQVLRLDCSSGRVVGIFKK